MDENTTNKISEILNSPDLIDNIQSVLSGLNLSNSSSEVLPAKAENEINVLNLFQNLSQSNILSTISKLLGENQSERIALLTALRPFLSSEKQETLDLVIQILKALNIFTAANSIVK